MFAPYIAQAAEFIRRISYCRHAPNRVPDSEKVSGGQIAQFDADLEAAVQQAFGANSAQHARFAAVRDARSSLLSKAHDAQDPAWDFNYWVVYYARVLDLLYDLEITFRQSAVPPAAAEQGG